MDGSHSLFQCSGKPTKTSESSYNIKEGHLKFKIENITVIKPPLLKIFYWQGLDIEGLNAKLSTEDNRIEHNLYLPSSQLNSKPLKIVFWLRSQCKHRINIKLKRIKNCQCVPMETRIGFNQFRHLYRCPHRRLINFNQELYDLEPDGQVAMTMVAYYYIIGEYVLSYELSVSDSRVIILHFHSHITTFDAVKSVLTTKLIPVNIKEHRSLSQPIWVRNITMENLQFQFSSKYRGLRLINPNLVVPRQSVWPLIVEYKPSDFENDLELILNCGSLEHYKIPIKCRGVLEDDITNQDVPLLDYECPDYLHVVYPNKLVFTNDRNEERTLMVAVHNYNQKCMEFRWQTYALSDYFNFSFEPAIFQLKPHHYKLCVVRAKSFERPLHFKCIPAVLEIHRILDKSTQIAKNELTEIESIDDVKWNEDSFVEHVLLHIDLKVNFPKLNMEKVEMKPNVTGNMKKNNNNITIFEKLFWEYLSNSNYMRDTSRIPKNLCYEEVICQNTKINSNEPITEINKTGALNILSSITAEACRNLSKNYRFLPPETLDKL